MQSLDIFGTWEDSVFGFTRVSRFQLVGNLLGAFAKPVHFYSLILKSVHFSNYLQNRSTFIAKSVTFITKWINFAKNSKSGPISELDFKRELILPLSQSFNWAERTGQGLNFPI
jgi:hypothetical protein